MFRLRALTRGTVTRQVLFSLFVIGVLATGLGYVTYATFEDADTSDKNPIQGGTMDLKLDGADTVPAAFSIDDGGPNATTSYNYTITSSGSLTPGNVSVDVSVAENDSGTEPTDPDLNAALNATETATLVEVTSFEYRYANGTLARDLRTGVTDGNGNGIIDLEDVMTQALPETDLPGPGAGGTAERYLVISVTLASDDDPSFVVDGNTAGNLTGADEDYMADGIDVVVTVTLEQDESG
ncbi:hypothetical protein [Haloarchaeobius sp. TZWWS8]|uniref:hypothetical protein n=1 Tax=Haloarchaeobius sp. TZWWS8 TaxID=3446121 RepID=UPI003EC03517